MQIVTVGEPKLAYAKLGWQEYLGRLQHYHTVRVTHIADKWAYDAAKLLQAVQGTYTIALVIGGRQLTSHQLAAFLEQKALAAQEISFLVGGPEGLPQAVIDQADMQLGLSQLTFPHDLAMVILAEALYRASTLNAGQAYHK